MTGAGGHTVEASSANFPAVVGNGVSMSKLLYPVFRPCC